MYKSEIKKIRETMPETGSAGLYVLSCEAGTLSN
jgi:hypothetical protein